MKKNHVFKWLMLVCLSVSSWGAWAETRVLMQTNLGKIELILDEKKAPKTVENFVKYAQSGFYNGTIFHRVIGQFMIQGGGFNAYMVQKQTQKPIENEAFNGLKNQRGTIAMARTNAPHSATSQFFINLVDNPNLDFTGKTPHGYGYAVFGRVSKGMDVVDKIAQVRTMQNGMHRDVPVQAIVIERVEIIQ